MKSNPKHILFFFFLCILLPPEISFNLGSIRLTPYRLMLLILTIPLLK